MVSRAQGFVPAASDVPPHRSTTVSSPMRTLTEPPASAPLAKFPSKVARTGANFSVVKPKAAMAGMGRVPLAGCGFVAFGHAGGNLAGEIRFALFQEGG